MEPPTKGQLLAELQTKAQASSHCAKCPTLQGILHGQDPESYQISHNKSFFYDVKEKIGIVQCPWLNRGCAAHEIELEFVDRCYQNNWPIPLDLNSSYLD